MTSEAMPELRDDVEVRLPLYDKVTGEMLPGYMAVDISVFTDGPTGLVRRCRVVEFEGYPDPTPAQEIDIIDRIVSGLPMAPVPPATVEHMDKVEKLYDVASLYPQEMSPKFRLPNERKSDALIAAANVWHKIPEFDNYEINPLAVIRNRWTKRVLDVTEDGDQKFVAMHDGKGFEHAVNVDYAMEKVYGK